MRAVPRPPKTRPEQLVHGALPRTYERTGLAGPEGDERFFERVAEVTAAFGDSTRRLIYLHVSGLTGTTTAEVARQFELHPNVARHHLDKLVAAGYLEVSLDQAPSGGGRPSKRYRRTDRIASVPASPRPAELVVQLLGRALALLPSADAEEMAEEVGERYGRALTAEMTPEGSATSLHSAMLIVADTLTDHGFEAHSETGDGPAVIVRDHCPFGSAAIEHPVLCATDRGMVKGLFAGLCGGAVSVKLSSRALGDASCESVTA